jgi:hypothetical protein
MLVHGTREAGYHSVVWNPSTSSGQVLASGVYFARFTATDAIGVCPASLTSPGQRDDQTAVWHAW